MALFRLVMLGDQTKSESFINTQIVPKANQNIQQVVGRPLGGSVALELEKKYTGIQARTFGAPVFDLTGMIPTYDNTHLEK